MNRSSEKFTGHGKAGGSLALWACACLALTAAPGVANAQENAGRFEVRSAYAELLNSVYYLNARIEYQLGKKGRDTLQSGVPLTLELEIEVERNRRFLPDWTMASLRQRYELKFHALSERYIVVNLNSGERTSFPTLSSALDALGRVNALPIIDAALLDPELQYRIRLRAVLDVREIPVALRIVAFLFGDSRIESEWYSWSLQD